MPRTVYHYTTPEGVFSILEKKTLRFTDCQYLNDMSEFIYIREPFIEAYKRLCDERGESIDNIESFADSMCMTTPYKNHDCEGFLKGHVWRRGWPPEYRYYVFCTSRSYDSANMWNYYVKNGMYRGYNLGIAVDVLENWFSQQGEENVKLVHGSVNYNKKQQSEMLYQKVKDLTEIHDKRKANANADPNLVDNAISDFQDDLSAYINEKKLFFKHPAFKSEQEYRFILKIHSDFHTNALAIKYRVGTSGIITPFVEWNFGSLKPLLLEQITLSPMIEEELAKESFERFLRNDVFQNISIVPSSIKLRF